MNFLTLRNLSYDLIDKSNKERVSYFYLIEKHSSLSKYELITSDFKEIDFNKDAYISDLKKYIDGMPIKKVIGKINMLNVVIDLHYKVLIPRMETEELINIAISKLKGHEKILDLCCGSGIIGLTLKKKYKDLEVIMSDLDLEAINQTKKNANINNLEVNIIQSNLFENIHDKFDVIIFNPPYVNRDLLNQNIINYEPFHAIYAADGGLEFYKKIIPMLKNYWKNNHSFLIIFEVGKDQYENTINLLIKEKINKKNIKFYFDIEKNIYFIVCDTRLM